MSKGIDAILKWSKEYSEIVENWRYWAKRVKDVIKKYLSDAKVYVFGSVVEGRYTGASDIDILIVSKDAPRSRRDRIKLQLLIEDALGLNFPRPNPLELHIVTPEEAEWYFKRLRIKYVEV